jgi:VanZ family protein
MKARWTWMMVALWALAIFAMSSIPGRAFPDVRVLHYDKVLHAIVYAVFGGLCCLALPARVPKHFAVAVAGLLAIAYGLTDEFHQLFVPGRSADLRDVVADGVGGLFGAGAAAIVVR